MSDKDDSMDGTIETLVKGLTKEGSEVKRRQQEHLTDVGGAGPFAADTHYNDGNYDDGTAASDYNGVGVVLMLLVVMTVLVMGMNMVLLVMMARVMTLIIMLLVILVVLVRVVMVTVVVLEAVMLTKAMIKAEMGLICLKTVMAMV